MESRDIILCPSCQLPKGREEKCSFCNCPGKRERLKGIQKMQILKGHTSPESAYLVEDYPYGFRLRCKIRYWLEHHPKHGTRFVSQTTNPKKEMLFWNKPKPSTYSFVAGCMYLDEEDHVAWTSLTEYKEIEECKSWLQTYREGLPEEVIKRVEVWIKKKEAYAEFLEH